MLNITNLKEKLIDMFAHHTMTDLVRNSGKLLKKSAGVSDHRQLYDNEDFQKYFNALKELRDDMDRVLEEKQGIRQVKDCLCWLNKNKKKSERDEKNIDYFNLGEELVRRGVYKNNWDKNQRAYFNTGMRMMKQWTDYFLSYTNRNCHETNEDFKDIITHVFSEDIYNEKKDKFNYVARLIFRLLDQHNLKCFFDNENITCGDILEDKIFEHCTSTYVFVQLVEIEVFKYKEGRDNWCYMEFKKFDQWGNKKRKGDYKRLQFILTRKDVFPAVLHGSHEEWRDKIIESKYINLEGLEFEQVRNKMAELASEIIGTRQRMLEDYYS